MNIILVGQTELKAGFMESSPEEGHHYVASCEVNDSLQAHTLPAYHLPLG